MIPVPHSLLPFALSTNPDDYISHDVFLPLSLIYFACLLTLDMPEFAFPLVELHFHVKCKFNHFIY